jgi:hypothetical protein
VWTFLLQATRISASPEGHALRRSHGYQGRPPRRRSNFTSPSCKAGPANPSQPATARRARRILAESWFHAGWAGTAGCGCASWAGRPKTLAQIGPPNTTLRVATLISIRENFHIDYNSCLVEFLCSPLSSPNVFNLSQVSLKPLGLKL